MPDTPNEAHYQALNPQPITVIQAWNLDYTEGNILKYVARYKYKGTPKEDLLKARRYLDWLIERYDG